jgi:hypothetical protein
MDSTTFFLDGDGEENVRPLAVRPEKAAEMLGISVTALWRLYKAGEIPRFKHGNKVFYRVATLDAWLAKREGFAQNAPASPALD